MEVKRTCAEKMRRYTPGPPTFVEATADSLELWWREMDAELLGQLEEPAMQDCGPTLMFVVEMIELCDLRQDDPAGVVVYCGRRNQCRVVDLEPNRLYCFQIHIKLSLSGHRLDSQLSAHGFACTSPMTPSCTGSTLSSLDVAWSPPVGGGVPFGGEGGGLRRGPGLPSADASERRAVSPYEESLHDSVIVYRLEVEGLGAVYEGKHRTCTVANLRPNTFYTMRLHMSIASTCVGVWSPSIAWPTPPEPPLVALLRPRNAVLAWSEPSSNHDPATHGGQGESAATTSMDFSTFTGASFSEGGGGGGGGGGGVGRQYDDREWQWPGNEDDFDLPGMAAMPPGAESGVDLRIRCYQIEVIELRGKPGGKTGGGGGGGEFRKKTEEALLRGDRDNAMIPPMETRMETMVDQVHRLGGVGDWGSGFATQQASPSSSPHANREAGRGGSGGQQRRQQLCTRVVYKGSDTRAEIVGLRPCTRYLMQVRTRFGGFVGLLYKAVSRVGCSN